MTMSPAIARAFMWGIVEVPKQDPAAEMTEEQREKIREMFAPKEGGE